MSERHTYLAATALLPVVLSLAQAHCGLPGLLLTGGGLAAGVTLWFRQRRQLLREQEAYSDAFRRELSGLRQELADCQEACRLLRAASVSGSPPGWFVTISQELRMPLSTIIGYSEMLQEGFDDMVGQEVLANVGTLNEASQQLHRLLYDIDDLAKIEAGQLALCCETFDVAVVVEDVLKEQQPYMQSHGETCTVLLAPDLGWMTADRPKFRRSLANVLRYAALLTTRRELILRVWCDTTVEGAWLCLHLGEGGEPDEALHTMAPDSRPACDTEAMLQRYGGTGLGLVVSQRLCHLMGGELVFTGAGHEGVSGTMRLPLHMPLPSHMDTENPGAPLVESPASNGVGGVATAEHVAEASSALF